MEEDRRDNNHRHCPQQNSGRRRSGQASSRGPEGRPKGRSAFAWPSPASWYFSHRVWARRHVGFLRHKSHDAPTKEVNYPSPSFLRAARSQAEEFIYAHDARGQRWVISPGTPSQVGACPVG